MATGGVETVALQSKITPESVNNVFTQRTAISIFANVTAWHGRTAWKHSLDLDDYRLGSFQQFFLPKEKAKLFFNKACQPVLLFFPKPS